MVEAESVTDNREPALPISDVAQLSAFAIERSKTTKQSQYSMDWELRSGQPNGFSAVIPAKAGIQIFSRRKPGTRLVPAFQWGDLAATTSPLSRGEFWIPVYTGMTLAVLFSIFAEPSQ
jgi:hypothetical protein